MYARCPLFAVSGFSSGGLAAQVTVIPIGVTSLPDISTARIRLKSYLVPFLWMWSARGAFSHAQILRGESS
jgi:hypothetical protein